MHTTRRAVALLTAVDTYARESLEAMTDDGWVTVGSAPAAAELRALRQACEVLTHLVWQKPSAAEVIETYAARMAEDLELIEREEGGA